ncbi:GyrI-like domain-containing protein [Cellulosimicrobium sp. TH-20]|uniref:GyrI-like domain-containing protein n=1 Tax=Cellulosimicrobium sp. TH-20 TaxID=1980001 RepID=UPI0011A35F51|nr:GyrI-like domain-containing protein [Cellulosimicrobium sp. TH-20]
MPSDKVDLKAFHRELYAPPRGRFVEVDVPTLAYLAVDGEGDPNTAPAYAQAVEALFSLSYAVKFASKRAGRDYVVGPLEGLWTADDPGTFVRREKGAWRWTLLVLQPDWVDEDTVVAATETLRAKKEPPTALDLVRRTSLTEGRSVQTLHVGPYDDEGPVLAELHDVYLPEHGLTFAGPHHEIYLSDVRRTDPAKLRTVLRQPVRPA